MYAIMIYGERLGYELHVWDSRHVIDGEVARDVYILVSFRINHEGELGITALYEVSSRVNPPRGRGRDRRNMTFGNDKVAMFGSVRSLVCLSPPPNRDRTPPWGCIGALSVLCAI
jgi:hypothetical protein